MPGSSPQHSTSRQLPKNPYVRSAKAARNVQHREAAVPNSATGSRCPIPATHRRRLWVEFGRMAHA